MGNYSDELRGRVSDRVHHVKGSKGFCLICGKFGSLSKDHVPPQGAITISKTEQHHITEILGGNQQKKLKGSKSTNGSKFRTICSSCNNSIGKCDTEIKSAHNMLTGEVTKYFLDHTRLYPRVEVPVDSIKYSRAMIGHILSATSVKECEREIGKSPYFDPLREFVLGDDFAIKETHEIYYWFYPYERHLSAKFLGFWDNGKQTHLSLLSFFPIAFMVAQKGHVARPAHASRMNHGDNRINLSLELHNVETSMFPFIELKGNQMYFLTDFQCITSKAVI